MTLLDTGTQVIILPGLVTRGRIQIQLIDFGQGFTVRKQSLHDLVNGVLLAHLVLLLPLLLSIQ